MSATSMVLFAWSRKTCYVVGATAFNTHGMSVENIVKLVTRRKMFNNKAACNVGFDIFVVRWMKANCIALPVPSA